MSRILGSWSGMRKYLEQEMLVEPLKGRIRYGCTAFPGMDSSRVFEVCIDGKQVKRFSWETVNSFFNENGFTANKNPYGLMEYWDEFLTLLEKCPIAERTEYTDEEFCSALKTYRNQDIQESVHSANPIIRMFAVMDRRIGKRTLQAIEDEMLCQPEWLREIYELRVSAEPGKKDLL